MLRNVHIPIQCRYFPADPATGRTDIDFQSNSRLGIDTIVGVRIYNLNDFHLLHYIIIVGKSACRVHTPPRLRVCVLVRRTLPVSLVPITGNRRAILLYHRGGGVRIGVGWVALWIDFRLRMRKVYLSSWGTFLSLTPCISRMKMVTICPLELSNSSRKFLNFHSRR